MSTVMKFTPGGGIKVVWSDDMAEVFEKAFGTKFAKARRRASIIMTVETGPFAGYFYADMSYLADMTGNDEHRVCLWPPHKLESACKKQEAEYVNAHYVLKAS